MKKIEYIIREAKSNDENMLFHMQKEIAELHKNARKDLFIDSFESKYTLNELKERISKTDNGIFVPVINSKVCGYIFCDILTHEKEKQFKKKNTLYIDDLFVEREFRHSGIAKALMDRAVIYGKEHDCYDMLLNVWEFNKSAVELYKNYGMTTRTRHMEKIL